MKKIIEKYRAIVVQIGTPYSVGTGFYIKDENLIITNEHVIRDNKEVTIEGENFERCTSKVLYVDALYDLAFLEGNQALYEQETEIHICDTDQLTQGETVVAVGHPFGYEYTATQGIISNTNHTVHNIGYIQHDAALNPGNSGGPLINTEGRVIGINNFIMKDGQSVGFSLPIKHLRDAIKEFRQQQEQTASRCTTCANVVFDGELLEEKNYCPHCGSKLVLPSQIKAYEAVGIAQTIERFVSELGHDVKLCRMGLDHWVINEGSAKIKLYYNEKSGIIFGDAYLCHLPQKNIAPIYEYLLKENYTLEGLSISIPANSKDIVLSLFIYDRYLNEETGKELFFSLFRKADDYDNVLIEKYKAIPRKDWKNKKNAT